MTGMPLTVSLFTVEYSGFDDSIITPSLVFLTVVSIVSGTFSASWTALTASPILKAVVKGERVSQLPKNSIETNNKNNFIKKLDELQVT